MNDEELRDVYLAGIKSSVEEFGEPTVAVVMKFVEERLPDSHGLRAVFEAGLKWSSSDPTKEEA